jgi:transcriptional regulator with XRE-family HTH domain
MPRKKLNYTDNYYKPFPNRLRRLMRGDAGKINRTVSQQELADYLGLKARQSVSAYCDGSGQPSWENIAKIAEYFSVSTDWLLGVTNIESVEQNIQVAAATLGISGKAAENLARISTETEDDNIFISLKKSAAHDALNRILESEDVLWVAEATDHLLDIEKARPRNIF